MASAVAAAIFKIFDTENDSATTDEESVSIGSSSANRDLEKAVPDQARSANKRKHAKNSGIDMEALDGHLNEQKPHFVISD